MARSAREAPPRAVGPVPRSRRTPGHDPSSYGYVPARAPSFDCRVSPNPVIFDGPEPERAMQTPARRFTADDAWRLQREHPDVHGYELVDGELVEVTPSTWPHGRMMVEVGRHLANHVAAHGGGRVCADVGFVLRVPGDPERVRGPDIAFVSDATLEDAGGEPAAKDGFVRMTPDLVIEIHSPTDERDVLDFHQRIRDYLDAGVRLLWVIYPEARYAVAYHPEGDARLLRERESLDGEDVLSGFRLPLAELFD